MATRLPNEIHNFRSFNSGSDISEESHIQNEGSSHRRLDLPAPRVSLLEAFALLSELVQRKDITNQDLDTLAKHGQTLYDGKNKGIWNGFKNFFGGMIPSYRRQRIQNNASHEELKSLINNRKEENKLVTEPEALEDGIAGNQTPEELDLTPAQKAEYQQRLHAALLQNPEPELHLPDVPQTPLKAKAPAQAKTPAKIKTTAKEETPAIAETVREKKVAKNEAAAPRLIKKYEKLSDRLVVLKEQGQRETLPAKMKALSNYPLLSRDISKATSELKSLLKAKGKNQEASRLIKEQMTLLETLKKQVDLASAQLGKRIESLSKAKKQIFSSDVHSTAKDM